MAHFSRLSAGFRISHCMAGILLVALWLNLAGGVPASSDEDPFAVNEGIKLFLNKSIDRSVDTLQQLRTLVHLVFEQNALHFTYQPVTRTAIETFEHHGGNCVSFTFLLIAMARCLGMEASFREADIDPIWSEMGRIPSLDGHADVAVKIGAREYLVDLFPAVDAIQVGGRTVSDQRAVAHFWNNRGAEVLGAGNYPEAMTFFHKALESDPTAGFVWTNIGVTEAILGDMDEAVGSYRAALRIDKNDLVAMSNLASLYQRMGRREDAAHYGNRVRKFNERNPYYHFYLGLQAYAAGYYAESLDQLHAALKLKSTDQKFYVAMANDYLRLGDLKKARQSIEQSLRYAPDAASRTLYSQKLEWLGARISRQ